MFKYICCSLALIFVTTKQIFRSFIYHCSFLTIIKPMKMLERNFNKEITLGIILQIYTHRVITMMLSDHLPRETRIIKCNKINYDTNTLVYMCYTLVFIYLFKYTSSLPFSIHSIEIIFTSWCIECIAKSNTYISPF